MNNYRLLRRTYSGNREEILNFLGTGAVKLMGVLRFFVLRELSRRANIRVDDRSVNCDLEDAVSPADQFRSDPKLRFDFRRQTGGRR